MKRILVCSDIHGQYDQFVELLEKAGYDAEKDQLILLGDYIDRGPKSRQVIEKVMELVETGAIALRGNHEQMMIDVCLHDDGMEQWLHNGGDKTIESYKGHRLTEVGRHAKWLDDNLKLYHETEEYVFVHAGVRPHLPLDKQRNTDLIWIRHNVICGLGKTIVHGHTPVQEVCKVHDQMFIDTGSVFGGKLTMVELPSGDLYEVA